MVTLPEMPKYDEYNESGVKWLGMIPVGWDVLRLKYAAKVNPTPNFKSVDPNSEACFLPMEKVEVNGLVKYDLKMPIKILKNGFTSFRINDVIIAKITPCFENGKGALLNKMPTEFGFGSTEFHVLRCFNGFSSSFLYYLSKTHLFMDLGERLMTGSAGQKRVPTDFVHNFRFAAPNYEKQVAIAEFLNKKTVQIDEAISIKEKQISLLKERKQIIIQKAVTKGLNPDAPMKDSGVDWIGKIPEHWEVRRSKFAFTQRKERARKDDIQLSATQAYGVIPQDEYEDKIGRKVTKILFHLEKRRHVEKDDFVISMRSFQGGLERAYAKGCIRSSYVVLKPIEKLDAAFYSFLLKLPTYVKALQRTANFIRDGQDLNFNNFSQVDLFIPPIGEQKAIAQYIKEMIISTDRGIELQEKQIEKLKEYKTTLINNAVTGKIKVA